MALQALGWQLLSGWLACLAHVRLLPALFDTVELNNSFYRLPTIEAFAAWRDAAPSKFRFAVKGSRFLTHNKKLKEPEQASI